MNKLIEKSNCPTVAVKLTQLLFSLFLTTTSGMVLADKAADTMIMTHKPTGKQAPASVNKEVPINKAPTNVNNQILSHTPKKPPEPIKNAPTSVGNEPIANTSSVQPPTSKKLNSPNKTPGSVRKIPEPSINNADALRDAAQARELASMKGAAEAAGNLSNMPETMNGTNPDLGLGGKGTTGLDGKKLKLPDHDVGELGMPAGNSKRSCILNGADLRFLLFVCRQIDWEYPLRHGCG